MKTLRLILGDQLNASHSWFAHTDSNVLYVMMEVRSETDYVAHHIQKVVGFFVAMRRFAEQLRAAGHQVHYITLDDRDNKQNFADNLSCLIAQYAIQHFEYQLPDEYRLDTILREYAAGLHITHRVLDTEHFLTPRQALAEMFVGKKTYLLETFYRRIRTQYGILMQGKEPLTGKWNYDADNRQAYRGEVPVPSPPRFGHDVREVVAMIQKMGVSTIGNIRSEVFDWCIDRAEALAVLDFFVRECLPYFGRFEDAMHSQEPFLFHSRLSWAMNIKLLSPREVVQRAVTHWEAHQDHISIAQIEGFVRQIVGWREYMRGVYWAQMPAFGQMNYFDHTRPLPEWYWTGKTRLNCLHHAITASLESAYAHHIQRLMITGNFALLAGISPDALDEWYLGIYQDAIEWVEITNTRGMSQFADGGLVGSKPYVSSANYIAKMSDYCGRCAYDAKKKVGHMACPFNSLYWHFYHRHAEKLASNPRIGMMYQTLKKMKPQEKQALLQQAEIYLARINEL